jgi:hypothetical protein
MLPMTKAKEQATHVSETSQKFLDAIVVKHGPIRVLGRFFLQAVTDLASRGLEIELISPEELLKANLANSDNWLPLVQVFDPRWSKVDTENMLAVAVRREGRVVGAHAVRRFDWTRSNFHEEIESYRFLYHDPPSQMQPGEKVTITAKAARNISGVVGFSGAAWVHPEERGHGLSHVIPRVAKALALSQWDVERIVAIMNQGVFDKGFAPRFGYHGIDWGITYESSRCGMKYLAILWMERAALEAYIGDYQLDAQSPHNMGLRGNQN